MAVSAEVRSLTRPPPHLEGNLFLHKPPKFGIPRSKRGFYVLLKTAIYQYETENTYRKGQRSLKELEIQLEKVCGITQCLIPSKQYKNCSFRLTLEDGTEYTFSAESKEAMEEWVSGLRAAKDFWAQQSKREEARKKNIQTPCHHSNNVSVHHEDKVDASLSCQSSEQSALAQVHVTTWDGVTHKVLLPLVFDLEELLSALSGKVQGTRCTSCPICKLQQSSMEVWTVTESGIGKKLDREDGELDVLKHGQHFYILVHNFKLLIIHFEDGTFQVLPCLVSLKAKEVSYLPIFADKLSSLGCGNFGLFLMNDMGTTFLFDPEEEPLRHALSGRLLLKNRALAISSPVPPSRSDVQKEKLQKAAQNRKNRKALKKVEHFKAGTLTNRAITSSHDDLLFCFDHYSDTEVEDGPPASRRTGYTASALTLSNGDRTCTLSENDSFKDVQISVEGVRTSTSRPDEESVTAHEDECFVRNKGPDSGSHENGREETTESVSDSSDSSTVNKRDQLLRQENEDSFVNNISVASPTLLLSCAPNMAKEMTTKEPSEPTKPSVNGVPASEQMEGSEKMEVKEIHMGQCTLDDGNAWLTSVGGEPALTDGISEIGSTAAHESSLDRKNKYVGTCNDFASGADITTGDETSHMQTCRLKKEGIAAAGTTASEPCEPVHLRNRGGEIVNQFSLSSTKLTSIGNDQSSSLSGSPSSQSSPSSSSAPEGEDPSDKATCPVSPDPTATSEVNGDLPEHRLLANERKKGHIDSSACKERLGFEIHQCDCTIVGSPRVLELYLKICSGQKTNEEEVGQANVLKRICLSGWHLRLERGRWSVEREGKPFRLGANLSCTVKVQLTESLEALFHKEDKVWVVVEYEHVSDECLVATNEIQNQTVNGMLSVPEDASNDPSVALKPERNVMFSNAKLEEEINDNAADFVVETSKPAKVHKSDNSMSDQSPQMELHTAIQGIFLHMSKFGDSPEEALDDSKHDRIIESVCEPLCRALWNLLSLGLRNRRFIGKFTVWDIVESFKRISDDVRGIVNWVNSKYPCLSQREKFQAFVCECLNFGHGALYLWLKGLLNQTESLAKYYSQRGFVFQLPHGKLEELVLDLSRISSLPFELHSESWIKRTQRYEFPVVAFE